MGAAAASAAAANGDSDDNAWMGMRCRYLLLLCRGMRELAESCSQQHDAAWLAPGLYRCHVLLLLSVLLLQIVLTSFDQFD